MFEAQVQEFYFLGETYVSMKGPVIYHPSLLLGRFFSLLFTLSLLQLPAMLIQGLASSPFTDAEF